jgi:hypothetical protein
MSNELGKMIGVVAHSYGIMANDGSKRNVNVKFDFTNSTDAEIRSWLVGNRAIAAQKPPKSMTLAEAIECYDGKVINASTCGQKQESDSQVVAKMAGSMAGKSAEEKLELILKLAKEAGIEM